MMQVDLHLTIYGDECEITAKEVTEELSIARIRRDNSSLTIYCPTFLNAVAIATELRKAAGLPLEPTDWQKPQPKTVPES